MAFEHKEYKARCLKLLEQMLPNSAALIPAAKLVTRSRDTEHTFRQDSDFSYLCGFPEPDAWLVISNKDGCPNPMLICHEKDELAEIWHGRRYGPELAEEHFAIDQAFGLNDIHELLEEVLNGLDNLYFAQGDRSEADELVFGLLQTLRNAPKQQKVAPVSLIDIRPLLHEMRLIKSDAEVRVMQKAADISVDAHIRAMQHASEDVYEYQLEAEILHHFAYNGARSAAYSSIVGSGDNACILHYTDNSDVLKNGDLVLIDAGAEYEGYAADITRTFPVSGQFSQPQRELYQLVLNAQEAAFSVIKPGVSLKVATDVAIEVITRGLIEFGILQGSIEKNIQEQNYRQYFMHGLGHWLGMDVHDVGSYRKGGEDRPLEPGMVLTVEPGIYISQSAEVDEKYAGIGIRIEDNLLIVEDGFINLTEAAPKTIDDIEHLMEGAKQSLTKKHYAAV
jgi:Xaa-Pro aminopeptidase